MDILTGAEMREADRRSIEDVGLPSRVLMESAGRGIAGAMEEHILDLADRSIVILCGKGNNGGDGLVVLRTLVGLGYDARAIVLAPFDDLAPDARENLHAARALGLLVDAVTSEAEWVEALQGIHDGEVVVDAILGTGLSSGARGLALTAIEDVNALETTCVSVDVPSGLSSDTGNIIGAAIDADITVALAAPKVCHYIPPACEYCGLVEVVEIGIPQSFLEHEEAGLTTIEPEDLIDVWPERAPSAHKGAFGHLLIVAGSVGKTGAAIMAAEAALRTGAGLVTVASAASAIPMMAPALPEAMWVPLPETERGALAEPAADAILKLAAERSAVAIGPGLGLDEETVALVRKVVGEAPKPIVIDADALNALQDRTDVIPTDKAVALTPHPGEAARLLGSTTADVQRDRLDAVRRLSSATGAHVLLKGFRSLVADASGHVHVNLTGNPGLATAGSGDVLTGIVGGLLAQDVDVSDALTAGVYVHGLAGDLAAAELGETSVIATDITRKLADAIQSLTAD